MRGQHCKSYDVKRETVHCYPVNSSLLTAVARDGWNLSAVFKFCFCFVLFCYITNHLMTGPLGNSEFCFPRISMFPSTSSRETLRFSGNKIHCSPRDQSLSVYCNTHRSFAVVRLIEVFACLLFFMFLLLLILIFFY